jgi:hypothetical protein
MPKSLTNAFSKKFENLKPSYEIVKVTDYQKGESQPKLI